MLKRAVLGLAILAAGISGCALPGGGPAPRPAPPALEPVSGETAPIAFSRSDAKLRRGDLVGAYRYDFVECYPFEESLYWGEGQLWGVDRGWRRTAHERLARLGFRVTDDPDRLFDDVDINRRSAGYLLGATIVDARLDVCDHMNISTGESANRQSGNAELEIEWTLYATLKRTVVFRAATRGTGVVRRSHRQGVTRMVEAAFVDALERLAADREFREILTTAPQVKAARRHGLAEAAPAGPGGPAEATPLVALPPVSSGSLEKRAARIRRAVVVVGSGLGHGSGFFITPTRLLTNAHVVQGDPVVPLKLGDGRETFARVTRRHVARDIALLEVTPDGYSSLPIRQRAPRLAETVFAVGTPLRRSLAGSFTRGTVSGFRRQSRTGMELIQADVDIQPGNSGGPLLDRHGNVVGIAVSGIGELSVGVNFFIPIADALKKLGLRLDAAPRGGDPQPPAPARPANDSEPEFLEDIGQPVRSGLGEG